jgi:hypothetical protein
MIDFIWLTKAGQAKRELSSKSCAASGDEFDAPISVEDYRGND